MPRPHGFSYRRYGDGTVVVTHGAHTAAVLHGERAERFLDEVERGDAQSVMARWTGNYKRGNERGARAHPRNQG
ncbi:hypothetical protein ACFYWP_18510 [Actinacidiphila glaucinigra]|uniref:hypothetical protein n=1 Tax=Actinacidiphila glaucinigra TaxID=235986 RepID=UPI0036BC446A